MTTGHPALVAHLERLIQERGRLPFSTYMAEVLYHPEHGYYAREHETNPIGAGGDFYTSADVDPAFGHLLAGLFEEMAAGITDFRFHDLRHSAASYLAMSGATLVEIAEVLGHRTFEMVRRYAHLSESHTSNVVARMNSRIFGNAS